MTSTASRRARERATDPRQAEELTAALLAAATARCLPVAGWTDPVSDPQLLRRSDGQSVYSTVGGRRFTSTAVIEAEETITAAAGIASRRSVLPLDTRPPLRLRPTPCAAESRMVGREISVVVNTVAVSIQGPVHVRRQLR